MPRQPRYLLQLLPRKGAPWKTVEKLKEERAAIYSGDVLARTADAWEIRLTCGRTEVEHWVLREKPAPEHVR